MEKQGSKYNFVKIMFKNNNCHRDRIHEIKEHYCGRNNRLYKRFNDVNTFKNIVIMLLKSFK